MDIATKASWKNLKGIEEPVVYSTAINYSLEEYEKIKRGYIPFDMNFKEFLYFEDDILHIHRSWTGKTQYEVYFEVSPQTARIKEIITDKSSWNLDYFEKDVNEENIIHDVKCLIKSLLLEERFRNEEKYYR